MSSEKLPPVMSLSGKVALWLMKATGMRGIKVDISGSAVSTLTNSFT